MNDNRYYELYTKSHGSIFLETPMTYDTVITTFEQDRKFFIKLVKKINEKNVALALSDITKILEIGVSRVGESEQKRKDRLHTLKV